MTVTAGCQTSARLIEVLPPDAQRPLSTAVMVIAALVLEDGRASRSNCAACGGFLSSTAVSGSLYSKDAWRLCDLYHLDRCQYIANCTVWPSATSAPSVPLAGVQFWIPQVDLSPLPLSQLFRFAGELWQDRLFPCHRRAQSVLLSRNVATSS